MMQDFVGNDLAIGDSVAFTEYNRHALTRGTVVGFSKGMGMVEIEYLLHGQTRKTKKTSGYVIKVVK